MGCSVGFGLGFSRSDMVNLLLETVALDGEGADHKRAPTDTDPFLSHWCHTERSKDVNLGYLIAANRIMLNLRNRLKESANSRYWLTCRAISSAGEHSLHTGGVTGSIPVSPTIFFIDRRLHLPLIPSSIRTTSPGATSWPMQALADGR